MATATGLANIYQAHFRPAEARRYSATLSPVARVYAGSAITDGRHCSPSTSYTVLSSKSGLCRSEPLRSGAVAHARRGRDYEADNSRSRDRRFEFSTDGEQVRAELWGTSIRIRQENLWQLALPVAMVLGLAAIISPLIIGAAFLALSVGAFVSVTAVAMSFMWIPMMMAFGGMFMFTMFPLMALGIFPLGFMLKNLASLAITIGAAGVGFSLMRNLISGSKPKKQKASSPPRGRQGTQDGPVLRADARSLDDEDEDDDQRGGRRDPESSRMEEELRDFDTLLAEREQRRRREEWRASKLRQP